MKSDYGWLIANEASGYITRMVNNYNTHEFTIVPQLSQNVSKIMQKEFDLSPVSSDLSDDLVSVNSFMRDLATSSRF